MNLFFFLLVSCWNYPDCITYRTPMQILTVTLPSICHLHNERGSHFSLACHPHNLRGIFTENTWVQFSFGTGYISCYFVQPRSDFSCCIDRGQRGLQVNILQFGREKFAILIKKNGKKANYGRNWMAKSR